jgi:micrococcal nuclease
MIFPSPGTLSLMSSFTRNPLFYRLNIRFIIPIIVLSSLLLYPAAPEDKFSTSSPDPAEAIVYITKTGTKYHRAECRFAKSGIPILLTEALNQQYLPCGVCNPPSPNLTPAHSPENKPVPPVPPTLDKSSGRIGGSPQNLYRVDLARLKSYRQADISSMASAVVTQVVDGDTVKVSLEGKPYTVRLIGVDTPETVAPGRPVEQFGKEASSFTRTSLQGKEVRLAFDWDLYDRYGRLLAYIYLPEGTCFNAELIRLGYAHAYTRYPFQFLKEFRDLEAEARTAKRGLWGN